MTESNEVKIIDRLIRIGLLLLLLTLSILILAPFLILLIWAVIIAVAEYRMFFRLSKLLGGKKILSALIIVFLGLMIIVVPTFFLAESSFHGIQSLRIAYQEGRLTIPPPTEDVKTWPLIGEKLFASWDLASHNLRSFIANYSEQLRSFGEWLINTLKSLGITIVQFVVSIIIAGVLLAKADLGEKASSKFAERLVGDRAEGFVKLTTGTIRSVVQGVLGIALIQALASAILFIAFSIPIPGLWALFILILAIVQLPPLLILGPMIIYIFSYYDTVPAIIFTVFAGIIGISDNILKPIFLGKGVDIPMLVILLGAIGGMLVFGILGLFVGAVILALSYKLLIAWLHEAE